MRRGVGFSVALAIVLVLGPAGLVAGQDEEASPPGGPFGCTPTALSDHEIYDHPLVRERWDRAAEVAPQACVMPSSGPVWECYYSEALPGGSSRLCWHPAPDDLGPEAPSQLHVGIDLDALRGLAEYALTIPEIQRLVGSGPATLDVVVGRQAARFAVEGFDVVDAAYAALPPLCTPFDVADVQSILPLADSARWADQGEQTLGVCTSTFPPNPDHCAFIERAPGTRSFLCWWGLASLEDADYRFDVAPDSLRAVLNAADPGRVARKALADSNIVIWSSDPFRRAALKAALQVYLEDPGELRPPPSDVGGTINLFGRDWTVAYFPRNGVLTPCARDGLGTWYWLNEFGTPNGFVGPATIEAMKRFIEEHGTAPSEDELLADLYLNYQPDATTMLDGAETPIDYVFVPGSPFSMLPVAQRGDGAFVRLHGDGRMKEPLSAQASAAVAKKLAATAEVAEHVDLNRQPGTMAQDLAFLSYAVRRNPAAPQIAALLSDLGNGTMPAPEDVLGLFPPESPRLRLGERYPYPDVGSAVAGGDAFALGMGAHHLLWWDLLRYGAIEADDSEATA